MCTVTWRAEQAGYHVFFNRDELRTRQPEDAPALRQVDDYTFIAAQDGDHSGTWLAVNAFGVTYALLNYYDRHGAYARKPSQSRGALPQRMAALKDPQPDSLISTLGSVDGFRPFHLVGFRPTGKSLYWIWDGVSLQVRSLESSDCPLTTSSYRSDEVAAARRDTYLALGPKPSPIALWQYHQSSSVLGTPFGVCMQRPDAQTMSISHIAVTNDHIYYHYQREPRDGQPRITSPPVILEKRK